MSNQWERLGNAQKAAYPQNMPGAINNRIPFMLAKDAAQNMPANPGSWNDTVESARVQGINLLGTILKFTPFPYAAQGLDKLTNGGFSKLMMAGARNVRSNYAFTRDVASKDAAMGMLTGLFTATGAVVGGIGGFAVGGPLGAAAGASLGAATAGSLQRNVAQSDFIKRTSNELYRASKFAESDAGQETYNFGRDVTRFTSSVTGWKTLGDTSKGVGAITSGLLNFGFEVATGPDVGLLKGTGVVARQSLIGGRIVPEKTGLFSKVLSKREAEQAAARYAEDIDLIKRTVAGEETAYTPVFKFYKENNAAVVAQRPEFRSEMGQIASHLVAGADDETIGLILRIGRHDWDAVDELRAKSAAKTAEYNRIDDAIDIAESGGLTYVSYRNQLLTVSKGNKSNLDFLKQEVDSLRKEVSWLDDAMSVRGSMTDRTVSKHAWVERVRNDLAKERAARKLELSKEGITKADRVVDGMQRETQLGGVIQGFYQRSPFSVPIRWVDRSTDDAPRGTVNFNDRLIAADRMRASIRATARYGAIDPKVGMKLYNDFLSATDEVTKYNIVQNYTKQLAEGLGKKYKVSELIVEEILNAYDEAHRSVLTEARAASLEGRGYMIAKNGEIIEDPQLISQLANGAYLPDVKMWDKAFQRYSKKLGEEASLPVGTAVRAKFIADEFNVLWRGMTLLRAGYPINVIRDSAVRMLGDGALFPVLKVLTSDTLKSITNSSNTSSKVKSALGPNNPKANAEKIRNDIFERDVTINALQKQLDEALGDGWATKTIPADMQRHVDYLNSLKATAAQLRKQENAINSKAPALKRVSRDKITVAGYDFPAAAAGRFGEISMQQLRQKDDLRRALSSIRELEASNVRRSRTGSRSITPREDEQLHLGSWMNILKDQIGNDAVARMMMQGSNKSQVTAWLRNTQDGQNYLKRVGLGPSDGPGVIYTRVGALLKQYAPNNKLHKLILDNDVTIDNLRKLYPNVDQRPVVHTDMVRDMLGTSNAYQKGKDLLRDGVAWLSTAPTSKLMYAPYFAVKYEQKLQNLVHLANVQGRKLTLKDREDFERLARGYAIKEYREKLNAFHRDMNYSGLVNYIIAFFPAVVEQFRAYGRIGLEHPDFIIKAVAVKSIPERVMPVTEDPFGQESVEVELPILGLTARLPVEWFNVFNPAGSSLLGAGPLATATFNEYAKRYGGEGPLAKKIENWVLPFGVQKNSLNALMPNTARRLSQVVLAAAGKGDQFNKDANMFLKQLRVDFVDEYHRRPTAIELEKLSDEAETRALLMATVRVVSSFTLPAQPRYVTAIQPYADELARMRKEDPINGEERFIEQNPDLFLLADSLSEATSGLRSDDTAVALVKKNPELVSDLVAILGENNLTSLGAIFNDDNYAFSSKAQAWLESSRIPKTGKMFRDTASFFESARSSEVSGGWRDWNKFVDTIEDTVREGIDGEEPLNPNRGYGKSIVDAYKKDYLEQMKAQNPLWFQEYDSYTGGGAGSRQARLVDALTYSINNDKLWKDLSKNPRWFAVTEYLNFRYDVYDTLKQMRTTIDSSRAYAVREDVAEFVDGLKRMDPNFGSFYERYFSNDKFDYVAGG